MSDRYPTLLDKAKATDPEGRIAAVAELLNQTNEMLADINFNEGNLATGHRHAIRTGLPNATWRKLYGGVQPSKSDREQVTESVGMLEAYNEIDKDLADLEGNSMEFRLDEASATIEGMSQELARTVLYGNTDIHPERFMGITPRYNDEVALNSENLIDGGGSDGAHLQSVWLISWGPQTAFGIYPKGSQAGIQFRDLGEETKVLADGSMYQIYRSHFQFKGGLVLKDWRYAVRICNIDVDALTSDASSGANLLDLMSDAIDRLPSMGRGNTAFYMSRAIRSIWRRQMSNAVKSSTLTLENVGGVKSPMFQEVPIRRVDALAVDEAEVTFS